MADVYTEAKNAGGDPTICSHTAGIAKKFNLQWASPVDHGRLPQIVDAYERYIGKRYGGERLHSGDTIYFSQFAKSALEHY